MKGAAEFTFSACGVSDISVRNSNGTQFKVNDFHFWRADRNQYGGGLVAYARSDLACDRKMNLEYQTIESICIEININNRKWLISGLYRPPSLSDSEFTKDYTKTFDKTTTNMKIS